MANWIKMRVDLADDPAVIGIAAALDIDEDSVVGKLHRVWSWFDSQTVDGNAKTVSGLTQAALPKTASVVGKKWIDRRVACEGFAEAMESVGWLISTEDGLQLPNFERHNGETSKNRALTAKRVAKSKGKKATADEKSNANTVTEALAEALPRIEKNRIEEEKENTHTPPTNGGSFLAGRSPAFNRFFQAYPKRVKPDLAWREWQAKVPVLAGHWGKPESEVEEFLITRAEMYAKSPSGQDPSGADDFRSSPADWLADGRYEEPESEWQRPNSRPSKKRDSPPKKDVSDVLDFFENAGILK